MKKKKKQKKNRVIRIPGWLFYLVRGTLCPGNMIGRIVAI